MYFSDAGADKVVLPPNTYSYPFCTGVPIGAPSSYEGEIGRVRYVVSAHVDRPWAFDMKANAVITVLNPLDLNMIPNAVVSTNWYIFEVLQLDNSRSGVS